MNHLMGWPVAKSYDADHLSRIAMPLGGIGTGTISLGGRANLCDWEITNKPRKGFAPRDSFFLLRCQRPGEPPQTRVVESELQPPFDHYRGFDAPGHGLYGLPRFRNGRFHAAYPLGQVELSSPDIPVAVRLQAFNPMVPGDAEKSGIPVAVLRFVLHNASDDLVHASMLGSLDNFIGDEYRTMAERGTEQPNVNRYRHCRSGEEHLHGIFMESGGTPPGHSSQGTLAFALMTDSATVRHHLDWRGGKRPVSLERLWRRFDRYGDLNVREEESRLPAAALTADVDLPPHEQRSLTFLIAWHFPNRCGWEADAEECGTGCDSQRVAQNWYATRYTGAWQVLEDITPRLPGLETETVTFVRSFLESDIPASLKEAALFNLSTLRSTTCFRLNNGHFFGFEGSSPGGGCCPGSCTHVWAYETATPYLYGSLSRSMREVHLLHATNAEGRMSFRVSLPLTDGTRQKGAAADGQMATLLKLYRDWKLCGDAAWLKQLWPQARAAMEYAWIENGWDADRDGVMEGVQHNTTDLELFGPNPLTATWYLAALRSVEEMARAVDDQAFGATCRALFEQGSTWVDEHLYNGEYYVQQPRRPPDPERVPEGLWLALPRPPENQPLPQQLGNGCQTDQLVGQLWAHVCDLGYILQKPHVKRTLETVFRRNFKELRRHPGFFRTFALNDEQALLFGTYPEDAVPASPLFRFSEIWNGCEYTAAALMIYEGQTQPAIRIIDAIRDRHDGRKRNPFNEPECGNHYVRSLASWTCFLAWTGFDYDAETATVQFRSADSPARYFWSNGSAWGTVRLDPDSTGVHGEITVLHGALEVKAIRVRGIGVWNNNERIRLGADDRLTFHATGA